MRLRSLMAATVAAAVLLAGCGSAAGTSPVLTSSPADGHTAAGANPSESSGAHSSSAAASSSAPAATSSSSSRQTAITVVAPPTSSPAGTSGPSTTSDRVVTTTVTVTPSRPTSTRARTTHADKPTTPAASSSPRTRPADSSVHTGALAGKVVVIDPGHNGANHLHPEIITKQVPAGFGEYKNCNTTGTETNAGYPEYRFNWKVALALRDALQAKGITVVMTRDSDDGVGPCVNKRAAIGNDAKADAVVSIHGDGEDPSVEGFYVMTASRPPAGRAMAAESDALAADIRDGLVGADFPVSNALGKNGLWTRSDLAGLNLSTRPTVMIECGNMRNASEAALMSSKSGQQRYAAGIAAGVIAYLGG